jgi:hypothetical protein
MPSAKRVIHLRVAVDRLLRSSAEDDHEVSGIEKGDKLVIGLGGVVGDVEAAREEVVAHSQNGGVEVDVECKSWRFGAVW